MQHPASYTTTYSGNRADGDSTNFYGDVYGNVNFLEKHREAGEPSPHQCLRDLRVTDPREDRARIEGDKDRLLQDCYAWILDDASFQQWRTRDESRLLWIKGDPGKGKTMMTIGVIDELSQPRPPHEAMPEAPVPADNPTPLLSFFFCQNTVPALNNAVSVLRGLIYMLVKQRDSLLRYVHEEYKAAGKQLFNGHNAIYSLRSILSSILNDASLPPTYLLVDALDECTSGLSKLLRIITDTSLTRRSRVKWLVTSRNIPEIERRLQPDVAGIKVSLEVSAGHVSKAVAAFVEYKVGQLDYDCKTRQEVQQVLHDKAEGTFLWVSLVCKELEEEPLLRTREVLRELPPGLDPLYERMMTHVKRQDARTVGYCEEILRTMTLAFRPLRLEELTATTGLPIDWFGGVRAVVDLVGRCGSFLTIREDIISFVHLSAKDFFTLGNGLQVFNGPLKEAQGRIAHRLLDTMNSKLRRDMCSLQKPGVRIQEATDRVRSSCLPQVAYACEYWVEHLQAGGHACSDMLADEGKVHRFFQKHLLHWLEAMCLLRKMPEAISALHQAQTLLDIPRGSSISKIIYDALQFATWNTSEIQGAPLQVYYGALVFAPEQSITRQQFAQDTLERWQVNYGLRRDWGPLLQTPGGHTDYVTSVAFSVAGDRLASASEDMTVQVRDTMTGQLLHTFKEHRDGVTSVTFSAAGDRLASASYDRTVRVWDTKTGQLLLTLDSHAHSVTSLAFSAAGDRLASSSRDHTVRVWDTKAGRPLHKFEDTGYVNDLTFSVDGLYVVTNQGSMLLPLAALSTSRLAPHLPAQRTSVLKRWVTADLEDILLIPKSYRPICSAVCSRYIAFGCSSGRVLLLEML